MNSFCDKEKNCHVKSKNQTGNDCSFKDRFGRVYNYFFSGFCHFDFKAGLWNHFLIVVHEI